MFSQETINRFYQSLSLLGLDSEASLDDVRKAYRRLALASHPDRFNNDPLRRSEAEEKMKQLNATYAWLQQNSWMFGIDWNERVKETQRQNVQEQKPQQEAQQETASDSYSSNTNEKRKKKKYQAPPVDHTEKRRSRVWPIWIAFMLVSSILRSIGSNNSMSSNHLDRFQEVRPPYQVVERRPVNSHFIDSLREQDSTAQPKPSFKEVFHPQFN